MIKSLIIAALVLALLGAAALTRPSETDFKGWFRERAKVTGGNAIERLFEGSKTESYLDECTYKNRLLWADVERNGQTVYSGLFGHWVVRGAAKPAKAG